MKIWTLMPLRAVALLALAACEPATTADTAPPEALNLSCTAFADVSGAALLAAYGQDNLVEQTLPGPEGESYTASVLYPNDPRRRLEIVWVDPATKLHPASIAVSGEDNVWTGPQGLSIGQELADIERINGRPFRLWGFDWDYGGWVSDWDGGVFASDAGCLTRVRFEASAERVNAAGDAEFRSDDPRMRDSAPRVVEFGLVFQAGRQF
jgi:hypothetical protein